MTEPLTPDAALREVRRILNDHILQLAEYGRGYPGSSHTTTFANEAIAIIDAALAKTEADRAAVTHAAMLAHTSLWDIGGLGHEPEDWTLCKREPCPTMARLAALQQEDQT